LLHGFPSASHLFRNLMPLLEKDFHVIAPDLVGFGRTEAPPREIFAYTFEHLTDVVEDFLKVLGVEKFYMYVFDYGAPVGFRLALRHPEAILGIVSQNGNVYEEGLGKKWEARKAYWAHPTAEGRKMFESAFAPETIIGQYTTGEAEGTVSPDGYSLDIFTRRPRATRSGRTISFWTTARMSRSIRISRNISASGGRSFSPCGAGMTRASFIPARRRSAGTFRRRRWSSSRAGISCWRQSIRKSRKRF